MFVVVLDLIFVCMCVFNCVEVCDVNFFDVVCGW